jgi:replicative DNA helicase
MTDTARADYGPNRTAPHAIEAEEAVLGCVLINPDAYFEVAPILRPDDFYLHKHRWIWDAFVALHDQRLPIDIITVAEELERHNQLGEVGGSAYLTRLINTVPTSLHAEAYGRLVEQEALRRRLLEAATAVAKLAYEEGRDIGEVVNDAEAAIFAVSERRLNKDLAPIKEAISQYYDRIKYLFEHQDEMLGVPTGFVDLDKLLGGLQQSDLIIIAGRPGAGKTGFMLNIAKNAALTYRKHVAVFSLEMSNDQLVQRLIAQETGIDSQRLRLADIHDHEWPLFVQAANVLSDATIFLDDTPALTPNQLRSKCRRLDQEYGLDLIIVDYLQLMQGEGRHENRVQEVSTISRGLKQLARELNVPVLAGAQLSRAVEQRSDKVPQLSDLRESGCLTGETLVTLASGERVPIRSLAGQQPEVVTLDGWQMRTAQASRVWQTGHRPVYKLITLMGRVIRATGNHPFRGLEGWRALQDLAVGDEIAAYEAQPLPFPSPGTRPWLSRPGEGKGPGDGVRTAIASPPTSTAIAEADVCWDTIASIEPDGEDHVFDMTVPSTHNFVANGLVVHNSLEQDSDIVMFIHRPDMYAGDSSKTNLADILVRKHRNGPTADIQLVFRGALTKFENAETRHVDLSHV